MILCRIDGNIVSSIGHPSMKGWPMLLCQPILEDGTEKGDPVIALDPLGAGLHEHVMLSTDGSTTQEVVGDEHSPLRNIIVGIVDQKEHS